MTRLSWARSTCRTEYRRAVFHTNLLLTVLDEPGDSTELLNKAPLSL